MYLSKSSRMKIIPPSGDIASPFAEHNAAASLLALKGRQQSLHWMVCLVGSGAAVELFTVGVEWAKKPAWFSLNRAPATGLRRWGGKKTTPHELPGNHRYCENALDPTVLLRLLDDWHLRHALQRDGVFRHKRHRDRKDIRDLHHHKVAHNIRAHPAGGCLIRCTHGHRSTCQIRPAKPRHIGVHLCCRGRARGPAGVCASRTQQHRIAGSFPRRFADRIVRVKCQAKLHEAEEQREQNWQAHCRLN